MKKLFSFATMLILTQNCCAQLSQAEIEKKVKETQQQIDKLKNDPRIKDFMKAAGNTDSLTKLMSKNNMTAVSTIKKKDTVSGEIPAMNAAVMASLPLRVFNKAELISYLHNLNSKLTELLRPMNGSGITDVSANAINKSGTSIAFWVMGQPYESVLIAAKAADLNPDNVTLLNNIGGILTSSGLAFNAVPILQYANEQQPGNNMILNNLGQAFFSLGDTKKAESYLLASIATAKYHPDANLALAYINKKKGNKASAISFAENSLRGAYNGSAYSLLLDLNPDAKLMDYIRHRYKQPAFFNYHKYPLLPQCEKVDEAVVLKPKYDAYQEMLAAVDKKFHDQAKQENEMARKTAPDIMAKAIKAHRDPLRPFADFAFAVLGDLNKEYTDKFIQHDKYKKEYEASIKELDIKYEAAYKAIEDKWKPIVDDLATGSQAESDAFDKICKEKNDLGNTYLPQYAILTESLQLKTVELYRDYLNDWSYWSFIAAVDDHAAKNVFYNLASMMIGTLKEINRTKFIYECIIPEKPLKSKNKELEMEYPECFIPAKVVLPLGALNLEISCDGYKLEAGEGFIGKIEYSLESGDVTIAFGVGGKLPKLFFEGGGVEGGGEGEVKSQFFLTLNKGRPVDWGVLWEAEIKAKIGIGEMETTIGVEEGLTAGFGSGVQMKEGGPLKNLIDKMYPVQPDAKQINKNVPLYKK
ncbi:MAG: hypothetical protein ABJA78_12310 [Ferruginibacter sp.]